MSVRSNGILLAAVLVAVPGVALGGLTAPHDKDDANTSCYYCHSLTTSTGFSSACLSCHNSGGALVKWAAGDEAVPGTQGISHSWSKAAISPRYGANIDYLAAPIPSKLVDGKLQCAVCHDPHRNLVAVKPESMRTSIPQGVPRAKTNTFNGVTTGSATLTLTVAAGTGAAGFRVRARTVTGGGGTFILSHVYGFNPNSWLNYVGGVWVEGTATGPGLAFTNGVDVPLDVSGVTIRLSAGALEGDYWDFFVAYPMLRMSNVNDAACITCHRERMMNHVRARGTDAGYLPNGVRKFSHPVGVGLNANGFGSDQTRVRDADGTVVTDIEGKVGTSTTDAADGGKNATNDLILEGGAVRCTTCHRVHNADSNSLSRDAR